MANISFYLVVYWLIFWRRFWVNPFFHSTSELLHTIFPTWVFIGKQIRQGRSWFKDPYYWGNLLGYSVNSSLYPPHLLSAYIGSFFKNLDAKWIVLNIFYLLHYLLASILWYHYFSVIIHLAPLVSLFGAITLTYSAYMIKQQPFIIYTICWIPGCLSGGWLGLGSLFMACLGGYYPLLILALPIIAYFAPSSLLGLVPGLIQIIPVTKAYKRSIRWGAESDKNFGKVPWWGFLDLLFPQLQKTYTNNVGFWEMAMFAGWIPLWTMWWFRDPIWFVVVIISIFFMTGIIWPKFLPRIPARFIYPFTLALGIMATLGLANLSLKRDMLLLLLVLQSISLLINSFLIPTDPFCELVEKPSESQLVYQTGHLTETVTKGYQGSMRPKNGHN